MDLRIKIKEEFKLSETGLKGWMSNANMVCPSCNKPGRFGIIVNDKYGSVHCFKCNYKNKLYNYLVSIDKEYLIQYEKAVSLEKKIKSINKNGKKYILKLKNDINLPYSFKNITDHWYLNDRGFTEYHYKCFTPGVVDSIIENQLKNHIVFVLYQDLKIAGWFARSYFTKEWHDQNMVDFKDKKADLNLRYVNAPNVDFASILGGFDEISDKTRVLIVVEGIFDKVNVDNLLGLHKQEKIKCVFVFGNKVSIQQIELLRQKSITNVILMFDFGTTQQQRRSALLMSRYWRVDVCNLDNDDVDPGEMSFNYLYKVLSKKSNAYNYFVSMMPQSIRNNDTKKQRFMDS